MKNTKFLIISTIVCLLLASLSCKKDDLQIDIDKDAIKKYLKENNIVAQCKDNVYYVENIVGTGEQCNAGDTVAIKYTVKTIMNPSKIIYSYTNIAEQIILPPIPTSGVSTTFGLQIGLTTMREGGQSTFYVPSVYAYGSDTIADTETNANLIYDVELCEIIRRDKKH